MISSSTIASNPYSSSMTVHNSGKASLQSIPGQPINISTISQNATAATSQNTASTINVVTHKPSLAGPSTANNLRDAQLGQENAGSKEAEAAAAEVEQVISQLKARDAEVRAHEMAHMGAAAGYSTGMSFTYQKGPDGRQYAIGGEVGIDTSKISNNPEATLLKAQIIQRAALAPAEPSGQDRKVAASATKMMAEAQAQIAENQRKEATSGADSLDSTDKEGDAVDGLQQGLGSQFIQGSDSAKSGIIMERGVFETRIGLQAMAG